MAVSMIKTKKSFDLLANWPKYLREICYYFPQPEEEQLWVPAVDVKER